MATNIEMPKLSDTMTEGTLIQWLKKPGDRIEIGDILAEIETDKATMEMEAFDEGILADIRVQAGGKAPVGSVLAVLLEDGEEVDSSTPAATTENTSAAPANSSSPAAATSTAPAPVQTSTATADGSRLRVSPLAKKIASEKGLDLSQIQGSGPGGRIVKADLSKAPAAAPTPVAANSPAPAPSASPAAIMPVIGTEDKVIPLTSMRRIIADRLLASKTTIPHFYLHVEVDAKPLMAIRKQINEQADASHGNKYTVNDFIVKALINACVAVPAVNASFAGDSVVQFKHVGLSVAIAVEDGLVTPVIKEAENKSLLQISQEIKDMASRARAKKLKPSEFDGGTITISNLGSFGVDFFDAIVNPPQAAILSVGAAIEKPVVQGGQIVPGLRMGLGLSVDHRVVDGAVAAEFLGVVKKLIENPTLMLI